MGNKQQIISECLNKRHELKEITSSNNSGMPGVYDVVRWCVNCGAIVIDTDVDGRTRPGNVMTMQNSALFTRYYKEQLDATAGNNKKE
jgi:DUF917 family protein